MNNALRDASYSIHKLTASADSLQSWKTRANTKTILTAAVTALHDLGYKIPNIQGLKQKHVETLVEHWKSKSLSNATMKNYIAKLRWACTEMNKQNVVRPGNASYGIEARSYLSLENKALHNISFDKISDDNIRLSLEAQRLFGLRREESLKLVVSEADKGEHLHLKGSWTKGGIERNIPITSQEQRDFLNKLHATIPKAQSLIPKDKSNKEQIKRYENQTSEAGLKNLHGLRHAYAQKRYEGLVKELTGGVGWQCPRQAGPNLRKMTEEQRNIDLQARGILTKELGHSRISITKIYLG